MMESRFLVSAAVSAYNSERFMRGRLQNLIDQTIFRKNQLEIIVIDSNSPQNEKGIVEEWTARYENIRYVRTEQRETVYGAWNRGIKLASGKYVINANADDRFSSDGLEKMAEELQRNENIHAVYGDWMVTRVENDSFDSDTDKFVFRYPEFFPPLLFYYQITSHASLIRKDIFNSIGFYDDNLKVFGDREFMFRFSVSGLKAKKIPSLVGLYLESPQSVERSEGSGAKEFASIREKYLMPENLVRLFGYKHIPDKKTLAHLYAVVGSMGHEFYTWNGKPVSDLQFAAHTSSIALSLDPENVHPGVSVIIPTCNRPETLVEALESVMNQTYKDFEIIVVNDGGVDVSDIIARYKDKCRISYLKLDEKYGPSAARNLGLKNARGKYIAYLDDDDVYYPRHLETLAGYLEKNGARAAYSDSYRVITKQEGNKSVRLSREVAHSEDFDKERLLVVNYMPTLNIMHERSCVDEAGLFDETLQTHEDWDLWIRMSRKFDFHHIKEITAEIRTGQAEAGPYTRRMDFMRTMKIIHWRYYDLAGEETLKKQQGVRQEFEKEINIKRRFFPDGFERLFLPINGRSRPGEISAKVSVIIPVYNGGERLQGLLQMIGSQRKVRPAEVIIVDSGSTDGSVRTAEEQGAKVVHINKSEFNHGDSRNLGAGHATGDYLVFTVQDAVPVSNYWLYKMLYPFIEYPELAALSAKQFVKDGADLFSVWENHNMSPFDRDCMWSLGGPVSDDEWRYIEGHMKNRLMHFDDVSSCIRRDIFDEIRYRPLMFAEDMDFGRRLAERGKAIAYLTTTGVYHWHERGAAYILKRYYTGAKSDFYIKKNELPFFFYRNGIDFETFVANVKSAHDLIMVSIEEIRNKKPDDPRAASRCFINRLSHNMESRPCMIGQAAGEIASHQDLGLDALLEHLIGESNSKVMQADNFRQNFLIPGFLDHLQRFSEFICSNYKTLKGGEADFVSGIYRIFAMVTGMAVGAYYLEAESLEKLTPDLRRIDRVLGGGICYAADVNRQAEKAGT